MRQPRSRLVAALLVASVLVTTVIAGFGWRVVQSQAELDTRRQRERIDAAADAMASGVRTSLAEADERLNALLASADASVGFDGAVTVARHADDVVVTPAGGLPFLPAELLPAPADDAPFTEAEIAEYAGRHAEAIAVTRNWRSSRTQPSAPPRSQSGPEPQRRPETRHRRRLSIGGSRRQATWARPRVARS